MVSLPRLRDSRDFSPYSSSAEWADEDEGEAGGSKSSNTSSSAPSEADVEGPAVAGSARLLIAKSLKYWLWLRVYGEKSCVQALPPRVTSRCKHADDLDHDGAAVQVPGIIPLYNDSIWIPHQRPQESGPRTKE